MTGELAGKTILLVDDDREVLASLQAALADTGAELKTAGDGNTALSMATEGQPDLLVLDMMLPKRSGFLVLEKLRKGKARTDPPRVIMITGNLGTRHKAYAESLGVDLYLTKPFRMERLVGAVKELIG